MRTSDDLSALVSSRICHDLISPIGAIGNGLELLLMTHKPSDFGPELELIQDSVDKAGAQIRLYRIAFGQASAEMRVSEAEVGAALEICYGVGRIKVAHDLPTEMRRDEVKCALLALMCLEKALPRGGNISLRADDGGWQVTALGAVDIKCLRLSPADSDLTDVSGIQALLLPAALKAAGREMQVTTTEDQITLRF